MGGVLWYGIQWQSVIQGGGVNLINKFRQFRKTYSKVFECSRQINEVGFSAVIWGEEGEGWGTPL